jgi:hypothetical protein
VEIALPRHRLIVAGGFRIAGWAIGVPSLLAMLSLAVGAFIFDRAPPPDHSAYLNVKTYGPMGALQNGAQALGNGLSFVGSIIGGVLGVLALSALVVALFAGLLYLIGRGLKARATWARIVAGLFSALLLLNGLAGLTYLTRGAAIADGLIVAALLYVLWVLIWKFAESGSGAPLRDQLSP